MPVLITFEQTPADEQEARLSHWVQLVKRFGKTLHWCLNHGGYWARGARRAGQLNKPALVETVQDLNAQFDNVWFETGEHRDGEYPFRPWQTKVHQLGEEIGFDKICFGSDWPYVDVDTKYFQLFDAVRNHSDWASQRQKTWFLGENAARFMVLPEAPKWTV